ncbi:hypothetical protein TeGR_g7251 [Tetraparma gracilis]|uniref:Uncharacterized protein n=1 Tax=Tetraparma gracilis TaxID=2962635 RepID=A0ABQ6M6U6_9STRA|nr:hypothetical protein TeGR_g7251 [Tetraparma gracilis]
MYPDFDVDSLFNLNEDGAEQTNLIDEASQSTTLAELGVSIDAHDAATVASVATADVGDLDMENKLLTDVKDNLPVVVGILLLVLGIVVVYCCCCTKKKVKREQMALRSIGGAGRWDKKDNELL